MALTGLTKIQKIGINTATIPTLGGSENVGVVTATTFVGDGSGLSNVTGSGSGVIVRDGGSLVGTAGTINFGTNLNVSTISAGIVTVTNAVSASALTNLSDVTITSASNGQILKHNGSVFVNTAETTYSQSSVASGSNINLRLTDSGGTNDDILITAGSNITFSSVTANGFTIAASGGGGGGGLSNVVEDTTPELGGNLNLNNKFISGSGGINVSGVTTSTSFVGALTGNVTGNADTATTATNVTVSANNSTDETVYPIFVDGASGGQGAETDTGLTYNPSSGNLTAAKFTGSGVALTGVVTSIVAGSNISLAGGPTGIVTISSSGGGGLSLSSGADNRVITASSATALNGESNLTFDGTTLALTGNQTASGSVVVGSGVTIDARGINAVGTALTAGRFHALTGSYRMQIGSTNQGFYMYNGNTLHSAWSWSSSASINQFRGNSGGNYPLVIDDFSYISINPKSSFVRLQYAESTKLVTDLGGVKITGVATATGFSGPLTGNVTGNADTATTSTRVTVTDQSADTTCNVLFTQAATGNQLPHTGTNLTFNSSSGALTAGSFVKSGGSSSQFLKADGSVDSNTYLTSGSYLENVSEDTTPQLGGNLDLNSKNITGTGEIRVVGLITATSAVKTWTLGASGSSHYTFTGDGFTSATNDPDIYLERGHRYAFLNNSGGSHPFQIRVSNGGSAYSTGVTNNGASSGYITFNVPWDAPASLYYQCTNHSSMGGNIYVRGGSSTVTVSGNGNNRVITGGSGGSLVAEDSFLYNGADEVSINHVSTSENSYLTIAANANRRKTLQFKNGSTINGCIGLGDSDEGTSTSLFLSAKNDPGGASPHMVIDSGGQFCLGTYNSNYGSNDGIVSIVNAASTGTENTLLTLWNPTTVADSRVGIDFLTNAQSGTGRDGAFIRGSNDGVTAKAHLQFGTIKDETYDTNFEIKSTGAVEISSDTGNDLLTLIPTASASTSLIINTWPDNTSGRNWAIRNRYTAHGRLEFMRSTANNNDPLTTVMYLDGSTVHIAGTLSKNAGSFKIPHPLVGLSTTKDLVHSFIEGPQMDLIYRGKVTLSSGAATVNLDTVSNMTEGTFVVLNRDVQCFTTNETGWGAVKGSVSGNILTISAQDSSSTDTISWMVIGERQDNTVKSLDLTDDNGDLIVEPLKESVINN